MEQEKKKLGVGKVLLYTFGGLILLSVVARMFSGSADDMREQAKANVQELSDRAKQVAEEAKQKSEPKLEVISWKFTTDRELGYAFVEGRVKNISSEPLKSVEAVATYSTKNGDFVTSDDALIEYNPIMPGQTSNFKIITSYNPEMNSASLEFKELMGGAIPFKGK